MTKHYDSIEDDRREGLVELRFHPDGRPLMGEGARIK